jgi:hypothetical protein
VKTILAVLALVVMVVAQDTRPRLELEPRLDLNGGGFQLVSGSMTGGIGMEDEHFLWHVSASYVAAKKATYCVDNCATEIVNPHGNTRSLDANLFGRTSGGWMVGTQGFYAQLRTTDYNKTGWGIGVGGGKDWASVGCPTCNGKTSLRLIVLYFLPIHTVDTDQGFTAIFTVPSPSESKRHVFFNVTASAGWIKTSPSSGYTHDGSSTMGLLFRF